MEITLLDQFAMAALQGILSNPQRSGSAEETAKMAYWRAIAMMEERKKHIEQDCEKWFKWNGGECPVEHHTHVAVVFRDGFESIANGGSLNWKHAHPDNPAYKKDILKYMVLK